ncbi:hypothetical protein BY996DRAFT_4581806 [Phakopsora pachyrhizi]|uniref:C2H2-type domain-containing protein n=1 Tax=Phakopsora pachyrhizi TaxID=170000 RepID=A0AAV0AQ12_PHAPC|nr:hypothetical protein BY996DRAFT_4581806 [Phakopsora pachyrhizi]CAH7670282.1 hypothetical protein PPACK8108_LOCUS4998 [Phakopsora pachyrhizi]
MRATSPHIAEDKERLAEQWKRYRQDFSRKQLVTFFEENKTKPWFREKYLPGPEFEDMRERLKKKGREGKVEAFVKGLNSGSFDIVNYDYLPVSRKFTGGKLLDKVENKTMNGGKTDGLLDAALNGKGEGALAENIFKDNDTNLELAGKAPELNGGDTQVEELSTNLDAEGEEYEDPDDEISNGLVDPNASLTLPSDLGSLIGESMKGRGGVDDIVILPPSENQLFIKSISPDLSREELEKVCILLLMQINNFTLHMMRAERPAYQKLRICPGLMNTSERIRKDLAQIRQLATQFEDDYFGGQSVSEEQRGSSAIERKVQVLAEDARFTGDEDSSSALVVDPQVNDDGDASDPKSTVAQELPLAVEKKALDLYLYYIRTAFNSCYYCACASEASWARMLDERLSLLLLKDLDPKNFGGESVDEEVHRLCQSQITDEGAGKFRCKNCSKLFKAMNFIEKHIISKHGEVLNQEPVERVKYLNNYILDPSHTTPPAPTAPDHLHHRGSAGPPSSMNPSNGMLPNMGPSMGNMNEFYHGSYPGMMGNHWGGHGGVVMGEPYSGYPPSMYAAYPGHPYPSMAGPPMFPNGSMAGGPHGGGGPHGPYQHYYMNHMGPAGYLPHYQPPHQVYSALPAIPALPQGGRLPHGNSRRLGDRISRNFADESYFFSNSQDNKRNRRDESLNSNFKSNKAGSNDTSLPNVVSADPRSKTVLAYNDLDTPAGDEIVLNY